MKLFDCIERYDDWSDTITIKSAKTNKVLYKGMIARLIGLSLSCLYYEREVIKEEYTTDGKVLYIQE